MSTSGKKTHTPDANGWLPIESAPKDGSLILLNVKRRFPSIIPARWRNDLLNQCWDGDGWWGHDDDATNWHPLPKPPVATPAEGERTT